VTAREHLAVVPIGPVDDGLLDRVAEGVARRVPWPVEIRRTAMDPASAWSAERGQHHSTHLLRRLDEEIPPPAVRVLGVGDLDLFVPILTFVFGEARLRGRSAVLGLKRLRPEFYGLPADPELLLERTVKEAVHEIGHTLSLVHCRVLDCVMASSATADAVDLKRDRFCDRCASAARAALRGS
jgi:archaemetzincin